MSFSPKDWTGTALANGRYQISGKLGEGGMGVVYRARDRNIDADVVIKVPLRSMLEVPEFSRRFQGEIRSLVRLSHPHIVKVSDVGEWEGLPFAVMQFLPGGNLEDRLAVGPGPDGRPGSRDPGAVSGWIAAIADALDYVHSQGYVHRDVKPGNILFDARGHAFLGDFGVAKVLASSADAQGSRTSMTGAGMVVGTPEYMAPELIMGERFDGRVDQYALAVTAFEMLCGRRPFEDEVKTKVLVLHTTKAPPAPTDLCPWIPDRLSKAVLRGLAKDPAGRYPDCNALAAAVVDALATAATMAVARPNPAAEERLRIKCPSCGASLAIIAHDYARLRKSGRSVPCPGCKGPIRASGPGEAGPAGAGSSRGGTMILTPQGDSGKFTTTDATTPTPTPSHAHRPPAGTVAVSPQGVAGANPDATAGQPRQTPPSQRRPSATMVEQPGPGGPAVPDGLTPGSSPAHPDRPAAPIPKADAGQSRAFRLAFGAAGALSVVVLGVILLLNGSGRETKTDATPRPSPTSLARATNPAGTVRPATRPIPTDQPRAGVVEADSKSEGEDAGRPSRPAPAPAGDDRPSVAAEATATATGTGTAGRVSRPRPGFGTAAPVPPDAEPDRPGGDGREPEPLADVEKDKDKDEAPVADAPPEGVGRVKESVALENLLRNPGAYADRVVTLSSLYCMATVATRRPGGSIVLPVIESELHIAANGSASLRRKDASDLGVDPELADWLQRLGRLRRISADPSAMPTWENNPAIVTVRVDGRGKLAKDAPACEIVRLEILTGLDLIPHAAGFRKTIRVGYNVLTFTKEGTQPGKGKAEEWAQPLRLGFLITKYKNFFEKQAAKWPLPQWLRFSGQVNEFLSQRVR